MQTDKQLVHLQDNYNDVKLWNDFIDKMPILKKGTEIPSWYTVAWLSCECYLYRRIFSMLQLR